MLSDELHHIKKIEEVADKPEAISIDMVKRAGIEVETDPKKKVAN